MNDEHKKRGYHIDDILICNSNPFVVFVDDESHYSRKLILCRSVSRKNAAYDYYYFVNVRV